MTRFLFGLGVWIDILSDLLSRDSSDDCSLSRQRAWSSLSFGSTRVMGQTKSANPTCYSLNKIRIGSFTTNDCGKVKL